MVYIVSYDIAEDKKRNKACRLLKDYGRRVQYSVFECRLSLDELLELLKRVAPLLTGARDSLRVYGLCHSCCDIALKLEPVRRGERGHLRGGTLQAARCIEKPIEFGVI